VQRLRGFVRGILIPENKFARECSRLVRDLRQRICRKVEPKYG
jgi:hypothetical protein